MRRSIPLARRVSPQSVGNGFRTILRAPAAQARRPEGETADYYALRAVEAFTELAMMAQLGVLDPVTSCASVALLG